MKPSNSASTIDELIALLTAEKEVLGGDAPLVMLSDDVMSGKGHAPSVQVMVLRGSPAKVSIRYGSTYISGGDPLNEEYMGVVRKNDPDAKAGIVLF